VVLELLLQEVEVAHLWAALQDLVLEMPLLF
jgi:hypothetical protein